MAGLVRNSPMRFVNASEKSLRNPQRSMKAKRDGAPSGLVTSV